MMQNQARFSMDWSDFYLERVGFEAKVNLRRNLKSGENVLGRSDVVNIDIGIESLHCSRKHCAITVTSNAVFIKDLNSSNGTTVNGVKKKGETAELHEGDVIGIVGGNNPMSDFVGNFNFVVYRLCKYSSSNIQTIEIDDDDPIVVSDEEDYNNPICLDSDGDESVDSKENYDVGIQLSRNFNIEMKKELKDIDEFEEACKKMKKEPSELLQADVDEGFNECNNALFYNHQFVSLDDIAHECNNDVQSDCDSNDSDRTVFFPGWHQQNHEIPHNCENTGLHGGEGESSNSLTNNTNGHILSPKSLDAISKDLKKALADLNSKKTSVEAKPLESTSMSVNTKSNNLNQKESTDLNLRLKETVSKLNTNDNKKRKVELIDPKPIVKKSKKIESGSSPQNGKVNKETNKEEKKENLRTLASTTSKMAIENKTKIHTTAKVKFTPHNRGHFLTEAAQSPGTPRNVNVRQKESLNKRQKEKVVINDVIELCTATTPVELEQQIYEHMSSGTSPQISSSEEKSPFTFSQNNSRKQQTQEFVNQVNVAVDIELFLCHEEDLDHEFTENETTDESFEKIEEKNDADDEEDEDDDDEENLYQIIMQLPPDTGTVRLIETVARPVNLKSILKRTNAATSITPKRKVSFKEQGFQFDPRHEIISKLTSYSKDEFNTVTEFCRNIDTNIRSFADTYDDYEEYRRTMIPLLTVELCKEVELEYANSSIHSFITVAVNDKNLEKRGDGRRMVFHCQAASLYKSQNVHDGHLMFVTCDHNGKEIEFIAMVVDIAYSNKLAYFTMETSALTEVLPISLLRIRPITIITNTLNSFNAVYNLKRSPLLDLVLNPLYSQIQQQLQHSTEDINYKGYDILDKTQQRILNTIYKRCIKLDVPNISLLDGAAGTGKTCMIVNLALQLVYGNDLPKPLKILICSKSNGCIDEITAKLINIRDITLGVHKKIQLARFGFLEQMNSAVRKVSVQKIKEAEDHNPQFCSYDELLDRKKLLNLKIQALALDGGLDDVRNFHLLQKQLYKVEALLDRFEGLGKKRLRDKTTFILNSCDIVCTTLGSISKLQNYVTKFDVCIIDEATQFNEPLTLLPFRFEMPSLVLVGDSQLLPVAPYSNVVKAKNFGNSLFARFQKLFLGKLGSPVFEMNFQYRLQQEILMWPNYQFYKSRLVPHELAMDTSFPITPYKIISYSLKRGMMESENIMLMIKVLLGHIDWKNHSIGIICTNFKQNSILKNKLRGEHPYITSNTSDSYLAEKDVIIIWISKEFGMCHLGQQQLLNKAVTRAKKSLLICGADLTNYKNRPIWKSLLENAQGRQRIQHYNTLSASKVCTSLSKEVFTKRRSKCDICKF